MNISQLEYFVSAVAEGSYARAAHKQYVTTQAISRAVKELEHEFGMSLMEREGRGVQPTPLGLLFCDQARFILEECANLQFIAAFQSTSTNLITDLSIAVPTAECRGDLYSRGLLMSLIRSNSNLRTQALFGLSSWCCNLLRSGYVDMALTLGEPSSDGEIISRYVASIEPKFAVSFKHPLADRAGMNIKKLDGMRFALPLDAGCSLVYLEHFLMAAGVSVSFESVGLNAEEHQRFIDAGGIVMVSGEDSSILPGVNRLILPQTSNLKLRLPVYVCTRRECGKLPLNAIHNMLKTRVVERDSP